MSTPKFRMLSSTDPANETCQAWFTVAGKEHPMFFLKNLQAHKVSDLIQAAYKSGMEDGKHSLALDLYRDLEVRL